MTFPTIKDKPILPTTYLLIAIIIMPLLSLLFPAAKFISLPWSLVGLLPFFTGIAINISADRQFQRHNTTVKPFQPSSALVVDGILHLSRNPMYLGFTLILLSIAILLGTAAPFLVIPLFVWLMNEHFIKAEEQKLEKSFGSAWWEYTQNVRRWV
ncbi:MAG: isoprenylcysteine carboxylmethyltransferase family protein [Chloroflexota bacterium]|nr:isoprenylcysteine carboxylmethyltransferase family protein [Chloroflexota bacterium]